MKCSKCRASDAARGVVQTQGVLSKWGDGVSVGGLSPPAPSLCSARDSWEGPSQSRPAAPTLPHPPPLSCMWLGQGLGCQTSLLSPNLPH